MSILIRQMNESDIDYVLEVENKVDIWDVSQNDSSYSREDIVQLNEDLKNIDVARQTRYIICRSSDKTRLGTVDLTDIDFNKGIASVGILIHDATDRRKGYALKALELIEQVGLEYGITKLHAVVHQGNEPSNKLFKKSGYELVTNSMSLARMNGDFINVEHYLKCLER